MPNDDNWDKDQYQGQIETIETIKILRAENAELKAKLEKIKKTWRDAAIEETDQDTFVMSSYEYRCLDDAFAEIEEE